jgi:hypothetical protein
VRVGCAIRSKTGLARQPAPWPTLTAAPHWRRKPAVLVRDRPLPYLFMAGSCRDNPQCVDFIV